MVFNVIIMKAEVERHKWEIQKRKADSGTPSWENQRTKWEKKRNYKKVNATNLYQKLKFTI